MGEKRGAKRTPVQRERDRERITELYLKGRLIAQIRDVINQEAASEGYSISYQMVWADLQTCRKQWQEDTKQNVDLIVSDQLKKIDVLEREYWDAWVQSKETKKATSVKSKGAKQKKSQKNGEVIEITPVAVEKWEKREERLGDPRYLDGVFQCIMARLKILGREGPDKEDLAKEAAERIRDDIKEIDSLMDLKPEQKEIENAQGNETPAA